jgi:UDP-N-acetylglucosamine:LPS N-acetylglucosamine transferase
LDTSPNPSIHAVPPSAHRVLLVCSTGGHLAQMHRLRPWWDRHERVWVTFRRPDARSLLAGEQTVWAYEPTTRNLWNLLRNTILAVQVLRRVRPEVIVSNGAGVAVPFFILGRLLGCRTVYIEVFDRISSATMTGRMCRRFTDLFCVQWPQQQRFYKGSVVVGPLL